MNKKIELAAKAAIECDDLAAFSEIFQAQQDAIKKHLLVNGNTFAHWSAAENAIECLKFMHANAFDFNAKNFDQSTLLWFSVMSGAMEATKFLLEIGCDPNEQCENGRNTAYALASLRACQDFPAMLELLVRYDCVIDMVDDTGMPILVFATDELNPEFIAAALPYITNINRTDANGRTALDYVAFAESEIELLCAELLLANGAQRGAGFQEGDDDSWNMFREEPDIDEDAEHQP